MEDIFFSLFIMTAVVVSIFSLLCLLDFVDREFRERPYSLVAIIILIFAIQFIWQTSDANINATPVGQQIDEDTHVSSPVDVNIRSEF